MYILSALSSWGEAYFLFWVGFLVIISFFSGNRLSADPSFFWYSTGTAKEKENICVREFLSTQTSHPWGVWKATSTTHEYVAACLSSSQPPLITVCFLSLPRNPGQGGAGLLLGLATSSLCLGYSRPNRASSEVVPLSAWAWDSNEDSRCKWVETSSGTAKWTT